jgi:hypothetical protein
MSKPANVADQIEAKNVSNILVKLQSGKILTPAEREAVVEYQNKKQPKAEESKKVVKESSLDNPEIVADICARLAAGETTRSICKSYPNQFERRFWAKMASDSEFSQQVSRARLAGQDALTAETLAIADEATEDNVQVARLRIWARQWYASKLAPKKYGDKLTTEVTGSEGGPLTISWLHKAPQTALESHKSE